MRIAIALLVASTVSSGSALHEQTASADCRSLRLMSRMARIAAWAHRDVVAEEMQKVCAANDVKTTRTWTAPTRKSMKLSSRTWYYPANGGSAINGRSLYYPADKQATTGSTWYYPKNGGQARFPPSSNPRPTDRDWREPRGNARMTEPELIDWACARIQCASARAEIGALSDEERVLAVIELAWSAHNATQK